MTMQTQEERARAALEERCANLERAVAILIGHHVSRDGDRVEHAARVFKGDPIQFVFTPLPGGGVDVSFKPRKDLDELVAEKRGLPAIFDCGCSRHKVAFGRCDHYLPNGEERP